METSPLVGMSRRWRIVPAFQEVSEMFERACTMLALALSAEALRRPCRGRTRPIEIRESVWLEELT
jgi:hypothetical protein